MMRTALIYKAANPQALKGRDDTKRPGQQEPLF